MAISEDDYLDEMDDGFVLIDGDVPIDGDVEEDSSTESILSFGSDDDDTYEISMSPNNSLARPRDAPQNLACHNIPREHAKFPHYIKLKENISVADVVLDSVLPFLPAKSLCRFRAVSQKWDQWIKSPFFGHRQTTQFKDISGLLCQFPGETPSFISLDKYAYGIPCSSLSFLPELVNIRTTCSGLLACQSPAGDNNYYVCNPATKLWRQLPKPILYHGPDSAIALAFEPSDFNFSAHYELICAVTLPDEAIVLFEIYSTRSRSWRVSSAVCCEIDALALNGDGFYMGGFVYWETQSGAVLAFHVRDEEFGIFSLPPGNNPTGALSVLGDELCYLSPHEHEGEFSIEVYGDMNMRLNRIIYLDPDVVGFNHGFCRALTFVDDDTLIVILGDLVLAYNARARDVKRLGLARRDGFTKYIPYVNSLIPGDHPMDLDLFN